MRRLTGFAALLLVTFLFSFCLAATPLEIDKILKSANATSYIEQKIKEYSKLKHPAFKGIVYQLKSLKNELASPPQLSVPETPKIGRPPYPLSVYDNLISTLYDITNNLASLKQKKKYLEEEVNELEGEEKELEAQWLQSKNLDTLAQLVGVQIALVEKNIKINQISPQIEGLEKAAQVIDEKLKRVFSHLKITAKDVDRAEQDLISSNKTLDQIESDIKAKSIYNNRRRVFLEAKLVSLKDPLKKEQIETELERLNLSLEELKQKEKLTRAKIHFQRFKVAWLSCESQRCKGKKRKATFDAISALLEREEGLKSELEADLDRIRGALHLATLKMINIQQQYEKLSYKAPRDLRKLLAMCRNLVNEYGNLAFNIQQNISQLESFILYMLKTKQLFALHSGLLERGVYTLSSKVKLLFGRIKKILYQPIITLGNTPITLGGILKFILIIFIGFVTAKFVRRRLKQFLILHTEVPRGTAESASTLVYYFILLLTLSVAVSSAGFSLKELTFIVGALSVGVGFGLQTIINNFVSGLILLTERSISVGDIVELENGVVGEVKEITMRSTVIRTYDGVDVIVPNSEFISGKVVSWSYDDDWRRLIIPFGVAYGTDPEKVEKLAIEAAREVPYTFEDKEHPIEVWFEGFGDSSLNFSLVVWTRMLTIPHKNAPKRARISAYYYSLHKKLTEAGIEIPFPQQDLHVRTLYPEVVERLKELKG